MNGICLEQQGKARSRNGYAGKRVAFMKAAAGTPRDGKTIFSVEGAG